MFVPFSNCLHFTGSSVELVGPLVFIESGPSFCAEVAPLVFKLSPRRVNHCSTGGESL